MAIAFDYTDSNNHIQDLTTYIKSLIDVEYDSIDINNVEAFRVMAKTMDEPMRSRILHTINYVCMNSQVNNVYGGAL